MTRRLPVALLALALAITGCGGASDDKNSKKPTHASASTSRTPNTTARDQAIAVRSTLALSDFPSGWEAKPADDEDQEASDHRIARCAGFDYDTYYGSDTGDANSKDFTSSDDETISNEVTIQAQESLATSNFQISTGDKFSKCFEAEAQRTVEKAAKDEEDFKVGKATLNELSFERLGDQSKALRLTIPVTAQGTDVDVYLDFVVVRVGRAETVIIAQSELSPFDVDELAKFAKIAVNRLTERVKG